MECTSSQSIILKRQIADQYRNREAIININNTQVFQWHLFRKKKNEKQ
jgi:hypothetical protein